MWPFRSAPEPSTPEAKPPIEFRADDSMFKRAENIWYALGFINDRMGAVPQIAGYLSMYRDWDRDPNNAARAAQAPTKPE
mgnify:FL=1